MYFVESGRRDGPTLVCVPGLLGGAENFNGMLAELEATFHVVRLDPNAERRLSDLTSEVMRELSYTSTADAVAEVLDRVGRPQAYLVGLSLGGKIVYDFAIKFPGRFRGAVITDVGPGPFEDSELYRFVDGLVTNAPLHLPWPEMREHLRNTIADRNLRSLIQSQIAYPGQKPPAIWKTGMKDFGEMLNRQRIGHQFDGLERVDAELVARGVQFRVLQSSSCSGISASSLPKIAELKSMHLRPVANSSHFLHITHKDLIVQELLAMLMPGT